MEKQPKFLGQKETSTNVDEPHEKNEMRFRALYELVAKNLLDQKEAGIDPVEKYITLDQGQRTFLEKKYGAEMVSEVIKNLTALHGASPEVNETMEALKPLLLRQIEIEWNPEELVRMQNNFPEMHIGVFHFGEIPSPINAVFTDGRTLTNESQVIELNLDLPGLMTPKAIVDSLKQLAEYVAARPEIEAIIGESWLFDHAISKRMGFEVLTDTNAENVVSSAPKIGNDLAYVARAGTSAQDKLKQYHVRWGGMSREMLIAKYGTKVNK